MRLCVPIPCFFGKQDFAESIRTVGRLGFDAAETYDWRSLRLDEVADACKESGVELLSMCTTEFRLTDPQYRQAFLDGLTESCEAANRVGAHKLITQVGQDIGLPRPVQHQAIVDTLCLAAPILQKHDVTLMIEPLNTYVNHPGYYLWSSLEGFQIVREVGSEFVKVVYDIYHQQVMEGNIIPTVTGNLACIAHLHAAGHPGRNELQYGESDYGVIFAAIDKAGYTGACGLEYSPLLDPVESLKIAKERYGGKQ